MSFCVMRRFVLIHAFMIGTTSAESPYLDLLAEDGLSHLGNSINREGWNVEGGVLTRSQHGAGHLRTKQHYRDFELVFEWKISEGGNSGVIYRSQKGRGLEYQILDDKRHRAGKRHAGTSASLYDLVAAPVDKPYKPPGQWNSGKIVAVGHHIEHWLNGEKVLQVELTGEDWKRRYRQSKYAEYNLENFGVVPSPIILQDHGSQVSFRHVLIRDFKSAGSDE